MSTTPSDGPWSRLAPQFTWRRSQAHLLDLARHVDDGRWHLCAPPGSGKTLIGLELARVLGRRTLVLSPTTAIRDQWTASTALFGADPADFASTSLDRAAPLLSITYQMLGAPGEATALLEDAAARAWTSRLTREIGATEARERLDTLAEAEPAEYRRLLAREVTRLRRSVVRARTIHDPEDEAEGTDRAASVDLADALGPRVRRIVDRIEALDIGTIVLDECHHLLDWWALVVSAVVDRVDPAVIGLTATLPDPDDAREAANYRQLLGPVDAELHLGALVAEGAVAPWIDAAALAEPTGAEAAWLDRWEQRLRDDLDDLLRRDNFMAWAIALVLDGDDSGQGLWHRDPLLARATLRWWRARDLAVPAGLALPDRADIDAAPTTDDRLALLDTWLHSAGTSADDDDRTETRRVTRRYGIHLTPTGIRWGRSVADIVCARSAGKATAAARIAEFELDRRLDGGEVLIVTERDRAGTPPAEIASVLDGGGGQAAGTTAGMLAAVCGSGAVAQGVAAVTGSGLWCDAVVADRFVVAAHTVDQPAPEVAGCDIPGVVEIRLAGSSSAVRLAAVERVMDAGIVRTLIATRGLVGEGWDRPQVAVLVDCSEAASPAATTQLRGRALRIDAARPDKVASLWDVTVVHAEARGDWDRLRRRHERWWGLDSDLDARGSLVTGPGKLHRRLDRTEPPSSDEQRAITEYGFARVGDLESVRDRWERVDASGVATSAVVVRRRSAPVRSVRTRPANHRTLAVGAAASSAAGVAGAAVAIGTGTVALWPAAVAALAGALTLLARRRTRRASEADVLRRLGEAVADGLAAIATLPHGEPSHRWSVEDLADATVAVDAEELRTAEGASDRQLRATILGVDDDLAAIWAAAMAEMLGGLGSPRWLLVMGDRSHRVPSAVGATRAAADAFAASVSSRFPDAELHRAGSPEAVEAVLAAAARRPDEVRTTLRWS